MNERNLAEHYLQLNNGTSHDGIQLPLCHSMIFFCIIGIFLFRFWFKFPAVTKSVFDLFRMAIGPSEKCTEKTSHTAKSFFVLIQKFVGADKVLPVS